MDTQNVTLALPKDLLRKAKRLAIERQTVTFGDAGRTAYG